MKKLLVDTILPFHNVYGSIYSVISPIATKYKFEKRDYPNPIFRLYLPTNLVRYKKLEYGKHNLYLLKSPLLSVETWEALLKRVPMVIVEEYSPRGGIRDFIVKFLLGFFKGIPFIVQTKRTEHFLKEIGINSFLVPPSEKKHTSSKTRTHLLFVGKLINSKNPRLFLHLAKHFKEEQFVIIGDGPLSEQMRKEARNIPNIKLISFVESKKELFNYFSNAKLLIHPAIRDPIAFVVVEALSCQTPVVASSATGASDYLPNEWVVPLHDTLAWSNKVKTILNHQQKNNKIAEKTFNSQHLDSSDEYFKEISEKLEREIDTKWPNLLSK